MPTTETNSPTPKCPLCNSDWFNGGTVFDHFTCGGTRDKLAGTFTETALCRLRRELAESKRIQASTEQVWHGAEAELTKEREVAARLCTENAELRKQVESLTKAICPDDSIKDIPGLLDFATDLQHAYNKLCDVEKIEKERDTMRAQLESLQAQLSTANANLAHADEKIAELQDHVRLYSESDKLTTAGEVRAELIKTQAQVKEAQKDKERLDWLEKYNGEHLVNWSHVPYIPNNAPLWDVRTAIDAAITARKEPR